MLQHFFSNASSSIFSNEFCPKAAVFIFNYITAIIAVSRLVPFCLVCSRDCIQQIFQRLFFFIRQSAPRNRNVRFEEHNIGELFVNVKRVNKRRNI